ncbi:hypothetical protein BDR04DRAFT_689657 [Suillus decipiens]|nr:hypothetical protein BDR04DRAFT_689657 [Suillus decipiens]
MSGLALTCISKSDLCLASYGHVRSTSLRYSGRAAQSGFNMWSWTQGPGLPIPFSDHLMNPCVLPQMTFIFAAAYTILFAIHA